MKHDSARWFVALATAIVCQLSVENVAGFFYKGAWSDEGVRPFYLSYSDVPDTYPYLNEARDISDIPDQSEELNKESDIFEYIKRPTISDETRKLNLTRLQLLNQVYGREDPVYPTGTGDIPLTIDNRQHHFANKRNDIDDKNDVNEDVDKLFGGFTESSSREDDSLEDDYEGDDLDEEPSETALMKESLDRPVPIYSLYHGTITMQDDGEDNDSEEDDGGDDYGDAYGENISDEDSDEDVDDYTDVADGDDDEDGIWDKDPRYIKDKEFKTSNPFKGQEYSQEDNTDYMNAVEDSVLSRMKRDTIGGRASHRRHASIETVAVVDNALYRAFLERGDGDIHRAMNEIRKYVTVTMAMANIRYATIRVPEVRMKIVLTGIVVSQTRDDAPWIEPLVQYYHSKAAVDADTALHQFQKWLPKQKQFPPYDLALALTGYALVRKGRYTARGMANVGTICETDKGLSSALINDRADFQTAHVVAHELGHVLGANHDGSEESRRCSPDQDYVMSPSASYSDTTFQNAHYFSTCSVMHFRVMLRKPQADCLFNKAIPAIKYSLWKNPPGREYSLDIQCQLVFGEKSGFCEGEAMKEVVCRRLWCKDPDDAQSCRTNALLSALPGTICGKGMHCRSRVCVPKGARTRSLKVRRTPRKSRKLHRKQTAASRNPRVRSRKKTGIRSRQRSRLDSRSHSRKNSRKPCVLDKNSEFCRREVQRNYSVCKRKRYQKLCCRTCHGLI